MDPRRAISSIQWGKYLEPEIQCIDIEEVLNQRNQLVRKIAMIARAAAGGAHGNEAEQLAAFHRICHLLSTNDP